MAGRHMHKGKYCPACQAEVEQSIVSARTAHCPCPSTADAIWYLNTEAPITRPPSAPSRSAVLRLDAAILTAPAAAPRRW
jgi:hypothetical protein